MSQKALKRKIRRGTDDSDSDFKLPAHYAKRDNLNLSDEGVKTRQNQNGSGSNNESDSDDNIALKNLINSEDNGKCDSPSRSRSVTPKNVKAKDIIDPEQTPQEQTQEMAQPEKDESCANGKKEHANGKENGSENGKEEELKCDEEAKTANDMEPLLLDSEDPELFFPEEESGSEMDFSDKGSPVLSRSVTRRSHTRNIPTPKTPKSVFEQNGADQEQTSRNTPNLQPVIFLEKLPEIAESVNAAETEESSQASTLDSNSECASSIAGEAERPPEIVVEIASKSGEQSAADLTIDSCVSASENDNESMLVNITGDDATRNIEFSCRDPSILDESNDSMFRNRSLRSLSSRRSIRPKTDDVYRRKAFHNQAKEEDRDRDGRSSMERAGMSLKRKQRSTSPDGPKRYKLEPDPEKSPGFLSYISSPIANIKNRFSRTQLPCSTPILKGYKAANPLLGAAEEGTSANTKDEVDETHVIPEKKWCVIM